MRKFKILLLVFIILLGSVLFFRNDILNIYQVLGENLYNWIYPKLFLQLPQIEKEITGDLIKEAEKEISTPSPLRAEEEAPEAFLTQTGVIEWTNLQREKYGLPSLKESAKLNLGAELKVQDMFQNQYFGHESPSGEGVADLAENFTYKFLAIGENLALGNFQNDKALVDGWMNSPGHRANILSSSYQEIGVAVGEGIFEGKTIWLAVQNFGLPLSVCPQPDLSLKEKINENQKQTLEFQRELLALEVEIRTTRPKKRNKEYLKKIEKYNILVSQYNSLVEETKVLINKYNSQVNLFNQCVVGIE